MKLKKLLKHNVNNIVEVRIRKGEEVVYRDSPKKIKWKFFKLQDYYFLYRKRWTWLRKLFNRFY